MTDSRILRITTSAECEGFAKNADRLNQPDLAKEARRRAVELRAINYGAKTDVEREALQAIYAFEEARSQQTGRRSRASRTWQSISRIGILPTVERVVTREKATMAYDALIEAGLGDLTFE